MITLVTTFQRRCLQILSHKPPHQQEGRPGTHPQTCFHSPTGEQDAFLIIEKSPIPYQAKNFDLIFPFSLRQVPFPVATVPEIFFIFWCIDSEQTIKLIWHQWWWKPVSILPEHRSKAFLDPSNPGTRVVLCVWNLQVQYILQRLIIIRNLIMLIMSVCMEPASTISKKASRSWSLSGTQSCIYKKLILWSWKWFKNLIVVFDRTLALWEISVATSLKKVVSKHCHHHLPPVMINFDLI